MGLLLLYLCVAILISFLCSILEAVLLSVTPSFIESLKVKGHHTAGGRLEAMKNDIDKPLAAILSFNTIAHTVGAAGVGAQAAKVFGNEYLGITSAILTLLILIFSEIIPKTIGATFWKSLTGFTVRALKVLIFLMYPLVILSKGITRLLSKDSEDKTISRAEVSAMADIGEKEGIFQKAESKMLKNMIRFRNIKAEDIMTPRTVMVMAQEDISVNALYQNANFSMFSRIPVFKENRDDISGYVHKNDVLTQLAEDQQSTLLKDIRRDIIMISGDVTLPELLDRYLEAREHIALATDRYGGVSGLVTMEDVMETVIGAEIMDEYDNEEDMQAYARKRWRNRASRLGLISERDTPSQDDENVVKYGLTGGHDPDPEDDQENTGHQ